MQTERKRKVSWRERGRGAGGGGSHLGSKKIVYLRRVYKTIRVGHHLSR